jgi:hypothetical protein
VKRLVLAALLAALAPAARAESPRVGSWDFSVGQYKPNIDAEPNLGGSRPWEDTFGSGRPFFLRTTINYDLTHYFGSLEIGFQTGYLQRAGHGRTATGAVSGDSTKFRMIPTSAVLTYRFDYLADRFSVPLAPYAKLALERYNWWVTDGSSHTSRSGGTFGWSATAGLALQLDFFDPTLARELDRETGINHTYIFAEGRKTKVDDFGSSKSWDLSDNRDISWAFGLLLVF